jgi:site-specific DNA-methyltransferase (adenine-specific)
MKYWFSENKDIKLYQGDGIEIMNKLIDLGIRVDAIITDPPYGTIKNIKEVNHGLSGKTEWDTKIDTDIMFKCIDKISREKANIIIFSQEPYTSELVQYNHMNINFSYRCIWVKDHFANSLIAKKAPVNYFEDICVFRKVFDSNFENPLRKYFEKLYFYINKPKSKIIEDIGQCVDHCFRHKSNQFKLPQEKTYNKLINIYKINEFKDYMTYDELKKVNKKYTSIFNLPKDSKYKSNILEYKKDYDGYHPTQKPIALLEDLIKTYTNEGDLVLDFTMGSGSTGVACKNLNRKFIGIELDEKYFDIAVERIKGE